MSDRQFEGADSTDDPSIDASGTVTDLVAEVYEVLELFASDSGAGVVGRNDASSATPVGVCGAAPHSNEGYGLSTPGDAGVGANGGWISGGALRV